MRIIPIFLNGTQYWQDLVTLSAQRASAILSDSDFIEHVRNWALFDDTVVSADDVGTTIERAGEVRIKVGFYSSFWTRAIAYEANGEVHFNTRKERSGAGGIGNVAHEVMHVLGFKHRGNSPSGNENTVPWRIGGWADKWAISAPAPQVPAGYTAGTRIDSAPPVSVL